MSRFQFYSNFVSKLQSFIFKWQVKMSSEFLLSKDTTIFVGGLQPNISEDEICNHFKDIGPIRRCNFMNTNVASRCFAFVEFENKDDGKISLILITNFAFSGTSDPRTQQEFP